MEKKLNAHSVKKPSAPASNLITYDCKEDGKRKRCKGSAEKSNKMPKDAI